jgi:transposase InsO family protein
MPDERKEGTVRFLKDALASFKAHGVTVERVMTGPKATPAGRHNGSAFKSRLFAAAIQAHGRQHKRARPYTPRTNGKTERFIQTSLREWAYPNAFHTSTERARAMRAWLCRYNSSRPRSALGGKPPISRIARNNLPDSDS